MFNFIYQFSNLSLFVMLTVFFIVFSLIAIYLVKKYIPLEMRYKDNAVIGNVSALISIIYGVLVGLMALYLINTISATSDSVQREANALADIYRNSKWLDEPAKTNIQNNIRDYIKYVINTEWPLMKKGNNLDLQGNYYMLGVTKELITYNKTHKDQQLFISAILNQVKNFYDARQLRIMLGYSSLSGQIWFVILVGALLTLMINYLYGMHFYFHVATVCAVALMSSAMIFLLLTLDRPFQGEFFIQPQAFIDVLYFIDKTS